jgi:hypothetical protein
MLSRLQNSYRILLTLMLIPFLMSTAWFGYDIYQLAAERQILKKDYSVVNSIQYGLLSVDRWRDHISHIVAVQIDQFNLKGRQETELKAALNDILNSLITQAEDMIDQKKTTLGGKLQKFAFKTFVDVDEIRKKVPEFSETIVQEIKDPQNKRRLKFIAKDKLEELADETRDIMMEESEYEAILKKYNKKELTDINLFILSRTDELQMTMYHDASFILANMLLFLLVWLLVRLKKFYFKPLFVMSVLLALIVLVIGVSTPMIEIDARIKEINFTLMNRNIQFADQVIFFQSKSILDVVSILIKTGKPDSIFVGLLILIFSVVFPLSKLLATEFYLLGKEKWKKNKVILFFAFHASKWSMADVMVVAIFMAYVGFKGILESQLSGLSMQTSSIKSIATDYTSLQPGFILFIAYVLFGLILSEILKRITDDRPKKNKSMMM